MSFDRRFELPNFDEYDVDTSDCEDCPYAEDSLCWKFGCIKDKD